MASLPSHPDRDPLTRRPRGGILRAVAIGLACAAILRSFVFMTVFAVTDAMADTVLEGDYVLALRSEFAPRVPFTSLRLPRLRAVQPGDVVVLRRPDVPRQQALKRCVARAGQTVEIREGRLHVDGAPRSEAYVRDRALSTGGLRADQDFGPYQVPAGRVFLLGDHRDASYDSRDWGAIAEEAIDGRVLLVYWSWDASRRRPRLDRIARAIE